VPGTWPARDRLEGRPVVLDHHRGGRVKRWLYTSREESVPSREMLLAKALVDMACPVLKEKMLESAQ